MCIYLNWKISRADYLSDFNTMLKSLDHIYKKTTKKASSGLFSTGVLAAFKLLIKESITCTVAARLLEISIDEKSNDCTPTPNHKLILMDNVSISVRSFSGQNV